MKIIKVNTPFGVYGIPLKLVAEDRANYYSTSVKEGTGKWVDQSEWDDNFNFVMNDGFEGIDWLINNLNWEDCEDFSKKMSDEILVSEEDFWTTSDDFEIIEVR